MASLGVSQEPPVSQEIDIGSLLDVSTEPQNAYPTSKDPARTKDAQARADREAGNAEAIIVWRGRNSSLGRRETAVSRKHESRGRQATKVEDVLIVGEAGAMILLSEISQ